MTNIYISFKYIVLLALSNLFLLSCVSNTKAVSFISPNSIVQGEIWRDSIGYLLRVSRNGFSFVEKGNLGLLLKDQDNLFKTLSFVKGPFLKSEAVNEMGISSSSIVHWNEYLLEFNEGEQIELRVFDDGLAYRYKINNAQTEKHILEEKSSWVIPEHTKVWFFERNNNWKLKSYAGEWISTTIEKLPTISKTGNVQGKPLIFQYSNGLYGILAEAGLFNYSGLRFESLPENTLKANFSEGEAGFTVEGDLLSPWRVVLASENLNQLVNQQNIFISLNPKPNSELFSDRSWIKPGRSVWRWWSNFTGTPEEEKKMVDYAIKLEFEYSLIDEGWEKWPNKWDELKEICQYAKKNDVAIWAWKNSKELNFPEDDYQIMQLFMDSLSQVGVSGIKVDFMDSEAKLLIDFDESVLINAAKRKLMVNFHGCQASTGEIKSFPNEMTREGIRGLELNVHTEGPIKAAHNAALPFTRFVLGHGDYTPLAFTAIGETTWAHQLATLVLFTSPLQVIAENPQILLQHPAIKDALPLIKKIPTVWDETIVLPGSEIGELAAMARRKNNDWYIGILNGGSEKDYEIDFTSLGVVVSEVVLYKDASQSIPNPITKETIKRGRHYSETITPFIMDTVQISDNKLIVNLAKHGGAVLLFNQETKRSGLGK